MASGIKKINETVIEDDRSLIIIQKSGTSSVDNKAIPNGAIKVTLGLDPYISVKTETDKFVGINASLSLIEKSITSNLLEDGIITQEKLADEAIGENKIANGSISTDKLQDGSVISDKIAIESILNDNISIADEKGLDNTKGISTNRIQKGAVTEERIANDAVTENKIRDGAVTSNKIEYRGVVSDNIALNNIQRYHIAPYAIGSDQIEAGAITSSKIASKAITLDNISNTVISYLKDFINAEIAIRITEWYQLMELNYLNKAIYHDGYGNITGADGSTVINNLKIYGKFEEDDE